jgi:hypothetical protein
MSDENKLKLALEKYLLLVHVAGWKQEIFTREANAHARDEGGTKNGARTRKG